MDPYKPLGPDLINARILKELTDVITNPLLMIFELSWESGEVPADWELENIALFKEGKKGRKDDPRKHRPVSFHVKAMEIIPRGIEKPLKCNTNIDHQHGFMRGQSCLSNLVSFNDKVTHLADQGKPVNIIFLYSSKAFNTGSSSIFFQ